VAKRKYTLKEQRLLNEFLYNFYKNCPQWKRVRLGPAVLKGEEKLYQVLRRWADAVVFDGKQIIIIEVKWHPKPEGVGELLLYRSLFPQTPEFQMFKDYPIRAVYVTTRYDKAIEDLCKKNKIEFVVYAPEWVKTMLAEEVSKPSTVRRR